MSKLWTRTRELLARTDKSPAEICMGAKVTLSWLMTIKYGMGNRGAVKFPAVDKVERLYEFLSGKTLDV